ncbi:hypothetical protein MBY25_003622 [Salmonella enterica]|nr:hypothetical protein [Salmonella enterica]EIW2349273.1 hypothetical protein [Salmonella enterica]
MESMAEGMIKDLVASGHALADDMTGAPSVLIRCLAAQLEVQLVRANALAAENAYLLNGAARELNTSWMFHKTMLGAQAALVCLSHGYQAAAREWLEGTTDEAGAEIPDDISVGELHEWFDRQMVSNDGKSGFLTRSEAEEAIRKACPATDAFLAEVRASARNEGINYAASRLAAAFNHGFLDKPVSEVLDVTRMILSAKEDLANAPLPAADGLSGEYAEKAIEEWAAQLRKGVAQ